MKLKIMILTASMACLPAVSDVQIHDANGVKTGSISASGTVFNASGAKTNSVDKQGNIYNKSGVKVGAIETKNKPPSNASDKKKQ